MKYSAVFCCLVLCIAQISAPVLGGDIDLTKLGDLPVRFNGRLATLEEVANSYALRLGKTVKFRNGKEEEFTALEWYIHTIANTSASHEVRYFFVSRECADHLDLETNQQQRYSIGQLGANEKFTDYIETIHRISFEDLTPIQKKIQSLVSNVRERFMLIQSHRSPWRSDKDELMDELKNLDRYKDLPVPRMVIPADRDSGKWQVLFSAALSEFVNVEVGIKSDKFQRCEYAKLLINLFDAVAQEDFDKFEANLALIKTFLEKQPYDRTAFRLKPPKHWVEKQVESPFDQKHYSDAMAMGLPLSKMDWDRKDQWASIIVNHFPPKKIDPVTLVNSWRLREGLPLLSAAEFKEQIKKEKFLNQECWVVELTTPEFIPSKKQRLVSRIFNHPSGTWTTSIYGDVPVVTKHLKAFESCLESIVIPDEVEKWIAVSEQIEPLVGDGVLFGLVRNGTQTAWLARVSGIAESVAKFKPEVIKAVSSFQERKPTESKIAFKAVTKWEKPSHWESWWDSGNKQTYFVRNGEHSVVVDLTVIQKLNDEQLITLANHLRKSHHRKVLPRDEIKQQLKQTAHGIVEIPIGMQEASRKSTTE